MKKIVFSIIVIAVTFQFFGQNFPVNKYKNLEKPQYSSAINSFNLGIAYGTTNFLNPVFENNIENELIKKSFGYNIKLAYIHGPILIDVSYFSSIFKPNEKLTNSLPDATGTFNYNHKGWEGAASYNLMVINNRWIKKHLLPYLGIGYHLSEVALTKDSEAISAFILNNSIWKTGLIYYVNPVVGFFGEYKATINSQKNMNGKYNQINFGLLIKTSY